MRSLYLNFSTFYQAVVKTRTSYTQYDSVSILLYGCLRQKAASDLTDRTSSCYVTGSHNINRNCLSDLFALPIQEIISRFVMLKFQNVESAVFACKNLLSIVTGLSENERYKILSLLSQNEKDIENRNYTFLASVFMYSLRCNTKNVFKLTKEEQNLLSSLDHTSNKENNVADKEESNARKDYAYSHDDVAPFSISSVRSFLQNDLSMQIKQYLFPEQLSEFQALCNLVLQPQNDIIPLDEGDVRILFDGLRYHDYCYAAMLGGDIVAIGRQFNLLHIREVRKIIIYIFSDKNLSLDDVETIEGYVQELVAVDSLIIFAAKEVETDRIECLLLWS